jgi:hypothetical protein
MGVPLTSAASWSWGDLKVPAPQKMKTTTMAPMARAMNQEREYFRNHCNIGLVYLVDLPKF